MVSSNSTVEVVLAGLGGVSWEINVLLYPLLPLHIYCQLYVHFFYVLHWSNSGADETVFDISILGRDWVQKKVMFIIIPELAPTFKTDNAAPMCSTNVCLEWKESETVQVCQVVSLWPLQYAMVFEWRNITTLLQRTQWSPGPSLAAMLLLQIEMCKMDTVVVT